MRRRLLPRYFVLLLILWGWPAVAVAEDNGAQDEPDAVVSEEEIDDVDGATIGETVEADSDEEVVEGDEVADEEPVLGPGGRELDTDYPGTEESLQPRMDTSRLEGLDVPEGEDPEEVYDLRVRELETQIDDLKERVFRSKSRIALLRETVLAENLAGSRAVVTFQNDLGRAYKIERAIFSVDGSQVYSSVDSNGEYSSDEGVEIFTGPMSPGTHTVSVTLGLRGSGYGLFSYAEGYEFDLRFSCQFTAEQGRTTLVTVQSYRSGNAFTAHEDRPDGVCQVSMVELRVDDIEDDIERDLEEGPLPPAGLD